MVWDNPMFWADLRVSMDKVVWIYFNVLCANGYLSNLGDLGVSKGGLCFGVFIGLGCFGNLNGLGISGVLITLMVSVLVNFGVVFSGLSGFGCFFSFSERRDFGRFCRPFGLRIFNGLVCFG